MLFTLHARLRVRRHPAFPTPFSWKGGEFSHNSDAFSAARARMCVLPRRNGEARCISSRFTGEQPFSAEVRGVADPRRELSGTKNLLEPRFRRASESAFAGLEKHVKTPMYSISYRRRLCARRITPFMAEMVLSAPGLASLIRDILKGLT